VRNFMSPPAEKARPAPVSTRALTFFVPSGRVGVGVHPTAGSRESVGVLRAEVREDTRAWNEVPRGKVRALRVEGEFRVMMPTYETTKQNDKQVEVRN